VKSIFGKSLTSLCMSGSTRFSALVRSCSSSNFLNRTMVAAFQRQIVLEYDKLIKNIKMEPHGTFPLPKSQLTHHRLKLVGSYGLSMPRRMNSTSAARRNHYLRWVIQHGIDKPIDFSPGRPIFMVLLGPLKPSPQRRGVFSPKETLNSKLNTQSKSSRRNICAHQR
jgi:hypothetical protein